MAPADGIKTCRETLTKTGEGLSRAGQPCVGMRKDPTIADINRFIEHGLVAIAFELWWMCNKCASQE